MILFAEESDDEEEDDPALTPINLEKYMEEKSKPPPPPEEGGDYPLNIPSPILLASSMVLGIVSTGSIFELTGGKTPQLGFETTLALVALGVPLCFFLFYASVKKATAETEEDDKRFEAENSRKGGRRRTFR